MAGAGGKGKIANYNASLTPEERKQSASKAGKASVKSRQEKKALKDIAKTLLDMALKPGQVPDIENISSVAEMGKSNMDVRTGLLLAAIKKGLEGDVKAQEMLFTLTGEKVDKQELQIKNDTPLSQTVIYLPDNKRGNS